MGLMNYNDILQFILKAACMRVKAEGVNVVIFLTPIE